jgi:hypothetical protein
MIVGNENFLSDMREGVRVAMEAEPYFFGIPIISERLKNIEGKISETVGKAGGLAILLVTPVVGGTITNLRGANFDKIQFVARVFENTKTNETGKDALNVAIYTAAFWSQVKPDALTATLKLDDPAVTLGNDPRYLTYDVAALTEGGTQIDIPRLEPPILDVNGGEVTMSHGTPGAFIFYTLNNSVPAPRNPLSAVYLGAFSPPAETPIRARAWLPGYLPSAESRVKIAALGTEQGAALVTESGATLIL